MAKVNNIKRLVKEDFPQQYQDLIDKVAFVYNPLAEQIIYAFNKNIDFDNLNQEFLTITVKVDGSGVPVNNSEIKTSLKTRVKGLEVIRADNTTDNATLTGAPFIVFTVKNNIITISQVTGLVPDKDYSVGVIIYG